MNRSTYNTSILCYFPLFFFLFSWVNPLAGFSTSEFYSAVALTKKVSFLENATAQNLIVFPENKTIECDQDLMNFALLGKATSKNSAVKFEFVDDTNLNDCGIGTVTRTWVGVFPNGKKTTATQKITVAKKRFFDRHDIIFPRDLTTNVCNNSLQPEQLEQPYGYPILSSDACNLTTISFEDQWVVSDFPSKIKIVRTWTVTDWCQFNPDAATNNSEDVTGRWVHTQIIKLVDFDAPIFEKCSEHLVIENEMNETGNIFSEIKIEATDCSPKLNYIFEIDTNKDGDVDFRGQGNDASGHYPEGTHNITFAATDLCGNSSRCSFDFTVIASKTKNRK